MTQYLNPTKRFSLTGHKSKLFLHNYKLWFFFEEKINAKELIWIVNEVKQIKLEVSDNFNERKIGLMNRKYLENDKGMIFIYDRLEPVNIWMYNTLIPLDIIFLKKIKLEK